MAEKVEGNLVLIGGGEDKEGEKVILKKVVDLAGGSKERVPQCPQRNHPPL
jgi:cyanophycinase